MLLTFIFVVCIHSLLLKPIFVSHTAHLFIHQLMGSLVVNNFDFE